VAELLAFREREGAAGDKCRGVAAVRRALVGGPRSDAALGAFSEGTATTKANRRRIVDRDFPFLGCCYGVGTLGPVVSATVDRTYSEPVGSVTITLSPAGRDDELFADLPDVFDAYGGHKEAVASLPAHVVSLASSASRPVQAFRVGNNVYATQFHPELDADGICTRIDVYKNYGYFAPEIAESLKLAAKTRNIEHPPTVLRRFAARYSRRI